MDFTYFDLNLWIFLAGEDTITSLCPSETSHAQIPCLGLSFFGRLFPNMVILLSFILHYFCDETSPLLSSSGESDLIFPLNVGWPYDWLCPIKCWRRDTLGCPVSHFESRVVSIFTFLKSSIWECCLRPTGSEKAQASSMKRPCRGKLSHPS